MDEQGTAVSLGWRKSSYSNGGATNCVEVGMLPWRKSTYSNGNGGACIEVAALPWRKSTYSNGGAQTCVEAAHMPGAVLVRDTKDHGAGPVLRVTPGDWARFTATVRAPAPLG